MVLGSTKLPTEMSTNNISLGVKATGVKGQQLYHLRVPIISKFWSLNLLETNGPLAFLYRDCCTFYCATKTKIGE
jgi:hypothetical protein